MSRSEIICLFLTVSILYIGWTLYSYSILLQHANFESNSNAVTSSISRLRRGGETTSQGGTSHNLFSYSMTFQDAAKVCSSRYPSVVFKMVHPFRMFTYPQQIHDLISASVLASENEPEKLFEANIRQDILAVLADASNPLILDIGANIGLHALFLASAGYRIHAFEPLPKNNAILECSFMVNQFDPSRVILNKFGLSDQTSRDSCMSVQSSNYGHSLVDSSKSDCEEDKKITLKRLDEYMYSNLQDEIPFLIKIDVEGHEYKALSAAKDYFLQHGIPNHIFSEFFPQLIHEAGSDPASYLQLFWDWGMTVKVVNENKILVKNDELYQRILEPNNIHVYDLHAFFSS